MIIGVINSTTADGLVIDSSAFEEALFWLEGSVLCVHLGIYFFEFDLQFGVLLEQSVDDVFVFFSFDSFGLALLIK